MNDTQRKAKALGDPDGITPDQFPMGIHPNGQYWKKRLGRPCYFGAVTAGWRAALDRFNHEWPYILAGRTPPPMSGDVDAASVEYIARAFMGRESKRLDRSLLKGHSFVDIRNAVEIATVSLGKHKRVAHLLPSDFADLRDALSYVWAKEGEGDAARWKKTDVRLGVAALRRRIVHVRAMFNWARREKLIVEVPNYGDDFKLVTETTLNKARKMGERKNGAKRFDPCDVLPIYNALGTQIQAAFLLSLNCGFTAADCSALPWHAVHLDNGYIDFARVKTGVERLRMYLWPETIEALRKVKALTLKPAAGLEDMVVHQDRGDLGEPIGDPILLRDCVFITSRGRPWVERTIKRDGAGLPVSVTNKDSIGLEFGKALVAVGLKRGGLGFGAGRHTFETHALRVADKPLVDSIMGHSTGEMSQRYDHAMIGDLKALAEGVRARLLTDPQWGKVAEAQASLRIAG